MRDNVKTRFYNKIIQGNATITKNRGSHNWLFMKVCVHFRVYPIQNIDFLSFIFVVKQNKFF